MKKQHKFKVINGKGRRPKSKKIIINLLLVAMFAAVLVWLYNFTHERVSARFVKTAIADAGVLEQKTALRGLVIRSERLVAAGKTGTLSWIAADGVRLSTGMPVAKVITGENTVEPVKMPVSGVVVRQLDGLENALQPEGLAAADPAYLAGVPIKVREIEEGELVQQGALLFKVVSEFNWLYFVQVSAGEFEQIRGADRLIMRFSFAPEADVPVKIAYESRDGDKFNLAFEIKEHIPGYLRQRQAEASLVTKKTEGVLVPVSALTEKDNQSGVYLLQKSVVRFKAVTVLEKDDERAVVEGLTAGSRVVTTPSLVREGKRI